MENHPIPQDVTGFQFKLIGNMTVKQFAYLLTGVIIAWAILQLPVNILIKLPFSIFSAALGIGLAYLPIGGRPMDSMIGHFIKALIRPTQFVYEKSGTPLYFFAKTMPRSKESKNIIPPFETDKLKLYLASIDDNPKNKLDAKENNFLESVSNMATSNFPFQTNVSATPTDQPIDASATPSEPLTTLPEPKLAAMPTYSPSSISSFKKTEDKNAKITPKTPKNIGPDIPSSPNMVTGVTKDPRGNTLPNILIEIKDKEDSPVRAFKTNEVGKFASATPLMNGDYVIEFEDPKLQHKFEPKTISATGQIILPIEAVSIDPREELRKSLFQHG